MSRLPVLLLPLLLTSALAAGLTGDPCTAATLSVCRLPRYCLDISSNRPAICPPDKPCVCAPSNLSALSPCTASTLCPPGERCAQHPLLPIPLCISCTVIQSQSLPVLGSQSCVPPSPPPPPLGPGLSGDRCRSFAADCVTGTLCLFRRPDALYACTAKLDPRCECLPPTGPRACTTSQSCPTGERCAQVANAPPAQQSPQCYGCQRVAMDDDVIPIDGNDNCNPAIPPAPEPSLDIDPTLPPDAPDAPDAPSQSLPPDSLPAPSDSAPAPDAPPAPASVAPTVTPSLLAAPSLSPSLSSPPSATSSPTFSSLPVQPPPSTPEPSTDPELSIEPSVVISPSPSPTSSSPSPTDDPVCIASHHLTHLSSASLVFPTHRSAVVLCDPHGSCATPGHVVLFQEQPMLMKRYCAEFVLRPCVHKVTRVNSPRFVRGVRVPSATKGLVFSALAARWESTLEEHVLTALLRVGM